jgi:nitroreductase
MRRILKVIRDRHSERGAFDASRSIEKSDLKLILEAARWAPTPNNMQNFEILIVDAKEQLEAIGKLPADMSESFLRENYAQLAFSEEELRVRKTGVLASIFPPAWTNPEAWTPDSDYRSQLTFLGRSVHETPLLLVVLYDGTKRGPGSEGDNMWLMSESLGIGFHVLTVFSDSPVEQEVKRVLHVPAAMKVAFACALGYPADPGAAYPRVRRELEEFVHHNEFGRKDVVWSSR